MVLIVHVAKLPDVTDNFQIDDKRYLIPTLQSSTRTLLTFFCVGRAGRRVD